MLCTLCYAIFAKRGTLKQFLRETTREATRRRIVGPITFDVASGGSSSTKLKGKLLGKLLGDMRAPTGVGAAADSFYREQVRTPQVQALFGE